VQEKCEIVQLSILACGGKLPDKYGASKTMKTSIDTRFNRCALLTAVLLAASFSARAQVVITTSGTNNYELQSFTVNGNTYTNWINATVTSIDAWALVSGNPRANFQVAQDGPQPAAADRMDLLRDNLLVTSIANVRELTVQFDTPVVNTPGSNILLFDYGAGDPFNLTINSQTITIASASFQSVLTGVVARQYRSATADGALDTLAKWTDPDNIFSSSGNLAATDISVLEVDLFDFGVALGGTIDTLTVTYSGTAGVFDPALIIAIPEPGTSALLLGSLAALVILRLRRRA
jgi:hypothetical protein